MKKSLFISATSTGIGKTVVSSIICRLLADDGLKITYFKPVQTGAILDNSRRISTDCRFVESVLKNNKDFKAHASYLFDKPASPHYAARLENATIGLKKIKDAHEELKKTSDFIIAEGAGGLYVPLDEKGSLMTELPILMDMNMVLIADAGLGTINQVGLSVNFARSKNINTSAVILISNSPLPTDIEIENQAILKKLLKIDEIYIVPAVKDIDTDNNKIGDLEDKIKYFPDAETIKKWINDYSLNYE